jgi:protein fantom
MIDVDSLELNTRQPSARVPPPTVDLQHGENVLELHLSRVEVTPEGAGLLPSSVPSLFVTYDFYEHQTQITKLRSGLRLAFDHSSHFKVTVNEAFLRYLLKGTLLLELHLAVGTSFKTVAVSNVRLVQLLDDNAAAAGRKVAMAVELFARDDPTVVLGKAFLWFRFQLPMEKAFRLHRQRIKAQMALAGVPLTADAAETSSVANALCLNVLQAHIHGQEGVEAAPSLYVAYQFGKESDYSTRTVQHSWMPAFDSRRVVFVRETPWLHEYLATSELLFIVVDDDGTDETAYYAKASLDMKPLRNNTPIQTELQLCNAEGTEVGSLQIELAWQRPYAGPQSLEATPERRQSAKVLVQPLQAEELPQTEESEPETSPPRGIPLLLDDSLPMQSSTSGFGQDMMQDVVQMATLPQPLETLPSRPATAQYDMELQAVESLELPQQLTGGLESMPGYSQQLLPTTAHSTLSV